MQQEVPQSSSGMNYNIGPENQQATPKAVDGGIRPDIEAKMVQWAKKQFDSIKQDRARTERQWYLNMSFYRGKQNVAMRAGSNLITGAAGSLYVPPAPYYRSRPVINRVRQIIRSEMAKLTSQKPTAYILPATSDDDDLFAAQAGEQIWESRYDQAKIPSIFRRALFWNQVCGNSFVRCIWDPNAEDKDVENAGQIPKPGEEAPPASKGDIRYQQVTPFHLFVPDQAEEDLEEQPFIIYAQLYTHDQVKNKYPTAKIQKQVNDQDQIIDQAYMDIIGANAPDNRRGVLCLEVWIKPGKTTVMPQGGMFTVVGESVVQLYDHGWPYIHGMYPFAKLDHIPTGKFYSDSTLVDLISLQREYNRTRGQIIEAKNRTAKPGMMAMRGSIDASKITTEPGQVIEYNMGYEKPTPIQLPDLPMYVLQELDRIIADMADISGQHEVSKGQVPPGVTAATAINYLQEQDDSILSYTFSSLEEAYEKIARMTLCYVKQFWDTPRMVRTAGSDEFFDVLMLRGSQLRGNTDIKIESGSALPLSKSAKQAFIMDLMQMGFVDPMTGLEVMEMGGIAKIYESVKTDVRQAQRENLRLAKIDDETFQQVIAEAGPEAVGQIVPVNTWDNHQVHIGTHNKFRKSQRFEMLSNAAKQAFEMHVQMHSLANAQAMTGENVIEMMKPENLEAGTEEGSGGNQFTAAQDLASQEAQNMQQQNTGGESGGDPTAGFTG